MHMLVATMMLLVQPTRAQSVESASPACSMIMMHHVLMDAAGATTHPTMMTVPAYVR